MAEEAWLGEAPDSESLTTYAFAPRDRAALIAWAATVGLAVQEDSETQGRLVRLAAVAQPTVLLGADLFAPGRALAAHTATIHRLTTRWQRLDAATFLPALAQHLPPDQGVFLITWVAEVDIVPEPGQQIYLPAYVLHPDGRYYGGDLTELANPTCAFGRGQWHPCPTIDLPLYDHGERRWYETGYYAQQAAWWRTTSKREDARA